MRLPNGEVRFSKPEYLEEYVVALAEHLDQLRVYDEELTLLAAKYANYGS